MKPVQYFSQEYLDRCRAMKVGQVLKFLDDFRLLHAARPAAKSRLISMKVPEDLLEAFKTRCRLASVPYQSHIKRLMRDWLAGEEAARR